MSIEGSLALVGLVLLALGVAVSARRTEHSSCAGEPVASESFEAGTVVDGPRAAPSTSSTVAAAALIVTGVVALLAAGVVVVAMWLLFGGLF